MTRNAFRKTILAASLFTFLLVPTLPAIGADGDGSGSLTDRLLNGMSRGGDLIIGFGGYFQDPDG